MNNQMSLSDIQNSVGYMASNLRDRVLPRILADAMKSNDTAAMLFGTFQSYQNLVGTQTIHTMLGGIANQQPRVVDWRNKFDTVVFLGQARSFVTPDGTCRLSWTYNIPYASGAVGPYFICKQRTGTGQEGVSDMFIATECLATHNGNDVTLNGVLLFFNKNNY